MKLLERKMKQPAITHQPAPRVPNEMARHKPDHGKIHQHVPAPSTKVNPKENPPEIHPIVRHIRSHTQNKQPPIALRTRSQLKQALKVTPYQDAQQYLPKDLLALCYTPVTDLAMPVPNSETGETLE